MKKILVLILLLAVSTTSCLTSCAPSRRTADEVLANIVDALEAEGYTLPPARYIYRFDAAAGTRSHLTESLAALIYYGERDANPRELNLLSDYAIRLSDDLSAVEIHVLRAANPADRDKIAELLQGRLDMMKNSDIHLFIPDAFEEYIAAGRVVIKGDFVILLITPDNEAAMRGI